MKNARIPRWESATLGIGFQFFNLFNHPNFGLHFPQSPKGAINDGDFKIGEITLIAGGQGESMNASRGGEQAIFAYRIGSMMHSTRILAKAHCVHG
jgi:hypothetical protein